MEEIFVIKTNEIVISIQWLVLTLNALIPRTT